MNPCGCVNGDERVQVADHAGNYETRERETRPPRDEAEHERGKKQDVHVDATSPTGHELVVRAQPSVGGRGAEQRRHRKGQRHGERQEQGHQTQDLTAGHFSEFHHVDHAATKPEHHGHGHRGKHEGLADFAEDVSLKGPGKRHGDELLADSACLWPAAQAARPATVAIDGENHRATTDGHRT